MDTLRYVMVLACLLLLGACGRLAQDEPEAAAQSDHRAADVAAIRRLAEEWERAWEAGDADAIVDLYADDPILMPQHCPAVVGRDAIDALYRSVLDEYAVEGDGEVLEIEVAGDWAFYRSTYTLTAVPHAGGEVLSDTGKCIFILRRQPEGPWKVSRLIVNSDLPPAGGA
jgi:uncharacterized protein (TIGR02246 family)